ncbi:MAG: phage integrase N-terminal SAM-like domain-containing protein [Cyanobacteria bacterium REEB459]|nr:phage integrase N-terminal SAM-like domain-containing protein [Cyanobacteria bacterium REEB459]
MNGIFPPIFRFLTETSKSTIKCTDRCLFFIQPPPKKLLVPVRDAIRLKYYAYRTEETYAQSIGRYILLHDKCHPREMGIAEVEAFLTYLAVEGQDVKTTLIYTYLLNPGDRGVRNPFDLGRVRP